MPWWRNGRRGGLKIRCQKWRVGSSPTQGTKFMKHTNNEAKCTRCNGTGFDTLKGWSDEAIDIILLFDETPACIECNGSGKNEEQELI